MITRIVKINSSRPERAKIQKAAAILKSGGLVAFPTETVYGLGACIYNERAIRKIFSVKKRPLDNPIPVLVASVGQAKEIACLTPSAYRLIKQFWPGPLSLVLKKKPAVPDIITAGLSYVAVRYPANPIAQALIEAVSCPIVASSANISGQPSPTCAKDVYKNLKGKIPVILDGGKTKIGIESTVVDLVHRPPRILRPGAIKGLTLL